MFGDARDLNKISKIGSVGDRSKIVGERLLSMNEALARDIGTSGSTFVLPEKSIS